MQKFTIAIWDRTFIVFYAENNPAGTRWWTDGDVGGKCWVENGVLIIGPTKSYGAACHYPEDHPEVVAEREAFQARAAALPPWTLTMDVVHFLDLVA